MRKRLFLLISLFSCSIAFADEPLLQHSGKYEVGFKDFHWTRGTFNNGSYSCPIFNADNLQEQDSSLGDPYYFYTPAEDKVNFKNNYSPNNQINFCRELMVRVYFPLNNHGDKKLAPIDKIVVDDFSNSLLPFLNPYLTQDQKTKLNQDLVQFQSTITNSFDFNQTKIAMNDVPFSNKNKFPVIFFSPGMGSVFQDYGDIISKLVRQGYFVVGINFTFVNNPGQPAHEIIFPSPDPAKPMIIPYMNETYNSQTDIKNINAANVTLLTDELPISDIIFALNQSTKLSIDQNSPIFYSMDMSRVALLGHSGGANYSVAVSQNKNTVKKYNLKAVGSLDSGYGLFTKADAVDAVTGQLIHPSWGYPSVGSNIPFMHLHSSTQDYGVPPPFYYLVQDGLMYVRNNVHEYWVYMASQQTFDDTPKYYPPPSVPVVFPADVYYSAHHNFSDVASLQFTDFYKDISSFYKINPTIFNPDHGSEIIPNQPWNLGTGDSKDISKNIYTYLNTFFDEYVKGIHSDKLEKSCKNQSSLTQNTLLKCGDNTK